LILLCLRVINYIISLINLHINQINFRHGHRVGAFWQGNSVFDTVYLRHYKDKNLQDEEDEPQQPMLLHFQNSSDVIALIGQFNEEGLLMNSGHLARPSRVWFEEGLVLRVEVEETEEVRQFVEPNRKEVPWYELGFQPGQNLADAEERRLAQGLYAHSTLCSLIKTYHGLLLNDTTYYRFPFYYPLGIKVV